MPLLKLLLSIICQMILHFTSTMNSFQWCHSSNRLAFFRAVLPLTRIVSHYRESMLSLWEDRCAHYEWSGALIMVIVRESWGWFSTGDVGRLLCVCMCLHTGKCSLTKTSNNTWISSFCWGYLRFSWSCCHAASWTCVCEFDVTELFMKAAVCRGIIAHGVAAGSFSHQFSQKTTKCYQLVNVCTAVWQKSWTLQSICNILQRTMHLYISTKT